MKSMKKNYVYNLLYTIINMIFPLITAPYLSYVLGAENIGKVNYATSIVTWFTIFSSFGIPRYGVREIARNRDDKKELSNSFWNLITIQLVLSLISIIIYLIIILNTSGLQKERTLHMIMVLIIVLNIFSIDWFYQGVEEYGYITIRNFIFKIISIILIFTMIKSKEHYLIYACINIFGLSFNNILNYVNTKKYVDKKIYKFKFFYYLKELKVYFMITLVVALYTQLDQTFVGTISERDLAYYLRSKTVLGVGFSIVNSLITIFIPRTAYLVKNNYLEYKNIVQKSINYIYLLALPCLVGIIMLSEEIMIFLGGDEFVQAKYSLLIIGVLVLITSIGSWQVNQILIPHKKEKLAFRIQCMAAIISISLNIILIPKYSYIGAAIAWVISEIFLTATEGLFIRKEIKSLKINYLNKTLLKYVISVVLMGIFVLMIKNTIINNNLIVILSVLISPIIYVLSALLLKDEIIYEIFNNLRKKIRKQNR